MAKALSKSQIAASIAETVGLTKKQAVQTIEALVALAYKNAKNSFTIPGLGKIVLVLSGESGRPGIEKLSALHRRKKRNLVAIL